VAARPGALGIAGARLYTLRITSATEGAVIPRLYGRMRIGGNIIWATDFREETKTTTQGGGKGGGGGKVKTTEYLYYASFAVALCEGPITGIGRVWADGKAMDMTGVTWRWYPGSEAQTADPFIAAKMGAANTSAYRGTAYVIFEELALSTYGNRLPQLSFEVFRPLADPDTAEGLVKAVTMIPASGEFTYATEAVRKRVGATTTLFGHTTGGTTFFHYEVTFGGTIAMGSGTSLKFAPGPLLTAAGPDPCGAPGAAQRRQGDAQKGIGAQGRQRQRHARQQAVDAFRREAAEGEQVERQPQQDVTGRVKLEFGIAGVPERIPVHDAAEARQRSGQRIPEAHELAGVIAPDEEVAHRVGAGGQPGHERQAQRGPGVG
jgi:hypothetical protein